MNTNRPLRGQVWKADLNPIRGHEQGGYRPFLVVSVNTFNQGPQELVMGCPMTHTLRSLRSQVRLDPPEGGIDAPTAILCDQLRVISQDRLAVCVGTVSADTMGKVSDFLRLVLDLS